MRPKTISASSLKNFRECPKKFKHVNIDFVPDARSSNPAKVGTSVHYALEKFVELVHMKKEAPDDLDILLAYYDEGYAKTFGTEDHDTDEYEDGLELTKKWWDRTDFAGREILSVERKVRTPIPSWMYPDPDRGAKVPLTYIFDRMDRYVDPKDQKDTVEVVDYKTERAFQSAKDIEGRIQCKIYALCAAIETQDNPPEKIIVTLDMLRQDAPASVTFDISQNAVTFEWLRRELQLILDTPDAPKGEPGEGCNYCPVKPRCKEFRANIEAGGIGSLSLVEAAALREQIKGQQKGFYTLLDELDGMLLAAGNAEETNELDLENYTVKFSVKKSRKISDPELAVKLVGPEILGKVATLGVGALDKILKSGQLNDDVSDQLRSLIYDDYANAPTVEVKKKAMRE